MISSSKASRLPNPVSLPTLTLLGPRHLKVLEAARKELEVRGEMLTPEAIAQRAQVSLAEAKRYLTSIGASAAPLPTTESMLEFVAARSARASIDAAVKQVKASLPAAYVKPDKPADDLLTQAKPHLRRTYADYVDWARGLGKGFLVAAAGATATGLMAHYHYKLGTWATAGVALLTTAAVLAVPIAYNALVNTIETHRVNRANAATAKKEAALVASFEQQQRDNAPAIAAQQAAKEGWEQRVAADLAAREGTIGSQHLDPIREALAAIKEPELAAIAANHIRYFLGELLGRRRELSVGAAADVTAWRELGHAAKQTPGFALGFDVDHVEIGRYASFTWLQTQLRAVTDGAAPAIADAYRVRYFDGDTCRVPGSREDQINFLVLLKAVSGNR